MNPDETVELIKRIGLADPRTIREDRAERIAMIAMWAGILTEVPFDFGLQAAQQHYAGSPWPILPADIADRWRKHLRDARERDVDALPDADPDNVPAWLAALRAGRNRHVIGARPRPVAALVAGLVAAKTIPDEAVEVRAALAPRRHPARAVACPKGACGARVGDGCTNDDGKPPLGGVHPTRIDRWAAATTACPTCGTPAGAECVEAGRPYPHGHRQRIDAAKQAAA